MDWRKNRLIIAAALLFGVFALSLASAQTSETDQIYACAGADGALRIRDAKETCLSNETPLTWNVTGPQGPQGPQGEPAPDTSGAPKKAVIGKLSIEGVVSDLDIVGYEWGLDQPLLVPGSGSGGGGGAGKATFERFTVVAPLNAASPQFLVKIASGAHMRTAKLVIFETGTSQSSMTYDFTDVMLAAAHHDAGQNAGDPPLETLSFTYNVIKETFTSPGGTTSGGWDLIGYRPAP
jgi:type VI secretion system secreted protein Hcp